MDRRYSTLYLNCKEIGYNVKETPYGSKIHSFLYVLYISRYFYWFNFISKNTFLLLSYFALANKLPRHLKRTIVLSSRIVERSKM